MGFASYTAKWKTLLGGKFELKFLSLESLFVFNIFMPAFKLSSTLLCLVLYFFSHSKIHFIRI